MKAFLICCFFVLCAYSFYGVQGCWPTDIKWQTSFRESFNLVCDSGKSLNSIGSSHSNEEEDRKWVIVCRDNKYITTSCKWSLPAGQYVNSYDGNVDFICPGKGYMIGMYAGNHHSYYNDRRFDFKCCEAKPNQGQTGCKWTGYVNTWDGDLYYKAPSGYFIAGAYSTHHDHYEDRRWKFYICQ